MNGKCEIDALKKIDLFSSLTEDELARAARRMVVKKFRKNEVILSEEETNEFMYMILEGEVKVVQTTADGKEIRLAIHRASDFFGELSLIDGKTVPATVLATKDSIMSIISKREFHTMIFSQRKMLETLLRILCFRYRESLKMIQMLNFNNASERLRLLFVMLSGRYGKKEGRDIVLDLRLTHQDIAEMAGLTRETVTRVIDKWLKEEEIVIRDKTFRLRQGFSEIGEKGIL